MLTACVVRVQAKSIPAARSSVVSEAEAMAADRQRLYDFIVYGSITRCKWNLGQWSTPRERVWLLFGDDGELSTNDAKGFGANGVVFARDMRA